MNFKETTDNDCPGCDKEIPNYDIKKHIQTCHQYPLFVLKEVNKFDDRTPPQVIKVPLPSC